jgi:hypothetical protein
MPELLEFEENTAGGMMNTEYVSLHDNASVMDALATMAFMISSVFRNFMSRLILQNRISDSSLNTCVTPFFSLPRITEYIKTGVKTVSLYFQDIRLFPLPGNVLEPI